MAGELGIAGGLMNYIKHSVSISLDCERNDDAGWLNVGIGTGGCEGEQGFITISFRDAEVVEVENTPFHEEIAVEEMPISTAIALRDFLNYALARIESPGYDRIERKLELVD